VTVHNNGGDEANTAGDKATEYPEFRYDQTRDPVHPVPGDNQEREHCECRDCTAHASSVRPVEHSMRSAAIDFFSTIFAAIAHETAHRSR
jgi:hypothetical protein